MCSLHISCAVAMPLITPTLSPRIGSASVVTVTVPFEAANGNISFAASSLDLEVMEPIVGTAPVVLNVMRTGGFGMATVSWNAAPAAGSTLDTIADIVPNSGIVAIGDGKRVYKLLRKFVFATTQPTRNLLCLFIHLFGGFLYLFVCLFLIWYVFVCVRSQVKTAVPSKSK